MDKPVTQNFGCDAHQPIYHKEIPPEVGMTCAFLMSTVVGLSTRVMTLFALCSEWSRLQTRG